MILYFRYVLVLSFCGFVYSHGENKLYERLARSNTTKNSSSFKIDEVDFVRSDRIPVYLTPNVSIADALRYGVVGDFGEYRPVNDTPTYVPYKGNEKSDSNENNTEQATTSPNESSTEEPSNATSNEPGETTEQPSKDENIEQPSENETTEKPSGDETSEQPSEDETTEQPSENETTEKPSEDETTEQPSEDETTEQPSENETTEKPSEDETTEQPSEDETTKQPSENDTTEKPSEDETTEQPSEDETTEQPSENDTTEKPSEDETTEKPSNITDDNSSDSDSLVVARAVKSVSQRLRVRTTKPLNVSERRHFNYSQRSPSRIPTSTAHIKSQNFISSVPLERPVVSNNGKALKQNFRNIAETNKTSLTDNTTNIPEEKKEVVLYGVFIKDGVAQIHEIHATKIGEEKVKLSTPSGLFFTRPFTLDSGNNSSITAFNSEGQTEEFRLLKIHQNGIRNDFLATPAGQLFFVEQ